jgi:hypothetical protein
MAGETWEVAEPAERVPVLGAGQRLLLSAQHDSEQDAAVERAAVATASVVLTASIAVVAAIHERNEDLRLALGLGLSSCRSIPSPDASKLHPAMVVFDWPATDAVETATVATDRARHIP